MNRLKLKEKLDLAGIYPGLYSLYGDLLPDRTVLYENYNIWEVFYLDERGGRRILGNFKSESEACEYIYTYLLSLDPELNTPKTSD